jgi:hypothetical protein
MNVEFTRDPKQLKLNEKGKFVDVTNVMRDIMLACDIYRVFTRKDFDELLFRMGILFGEIKPIGNFLTNQQLFNFKLPYKGYNRVVDLEVLINHIGAEASLKPEYMVREEWLNNYLNESLDYNEEILMSLDKIEMWYHNISEYEGKMTVPIEVTPNLIKEANLLRECISKEVEESYFIESAYKASNRVIEMKEDKKLTSSLVYEATEIPKKLQQIFNKHIAKYKGDNELSKKGKQQLMYLCWLWGNGLVTHDVDRGMFVNDLYKFDYFISDFGFLDFNLGKMKSHYNLDQIIPLFINKVTQ